MISAKRYSVRGALNKVLLNLWRNGFESISEIPENWEIAKYRVGFLNPIEKHNQYHWNQYSVRPNPNWIEVTHKSEKNEDKSEIEIKGMSHSCRIILKIETIEKSLALKEANDSNFNKMKRD